MPTAVLEKVRLKGPCTHSCPLAGTAVHPHHPSTSLGGQRGSRGLLLRAFAWAVPSTCNTVPLIVLPAAPLPQTHLHHISAPQVACLCSTDVFCCRSGFCGAPSRPLEPHTYTTGSSQYLLGGHLTTWMPVASEAQGRMAGPHPMLPTPVGLGTGLLQSCVLNSRAEAPS